VKDNIFLYPLTEKTVRAYAENIFIPIKRGGSVTTVWIPMSGRRKHNKFIIENIHLFRKELPEFEKYVLVYVEPLDIMEESTSGYIRLMAKSFISAAQERKDTRIKINKSLINIFDESQASYSKLLKRCAMF
jgi:hypothetical protein